MWRFVKKLIHDLTLFQKIGSESVSLENFWFKTRLFQKPFCLIIVFFKKAQKTNLWCLNRVKIVETWPLESYFSLQLRYRGKNCENRGVVEKLLQSQARCGRSRIKIQRSLRIWIQNLTRSKKMIWNFFDFQLLFQILADWSLLCCCLGTEQNWRNNAKDFFGECVACFCFAIGCGFLLVAVFVSIAYFPHALLIGFALPLDLCKLLWTAKNGVFTKIFPKVAKLLACVQ